MLFGNLRRPKSHLSEEEQERQLERFRANAFDPEDERAMIWAALRIFLPVVLGLVAAFSGLTWLLMKLWLG